MQVTMTMEEYTKLITANAKQVEQLNKMMEKYEKSNENYIKNKVIVEAVIDFFESNEIECVEQVSQSETMSNKLEEFVIRLFEISNELRFDKKVQSEIDRMIDNLRN